MLHASFWRRVVLTILCVLVVAMLLPLSMPPHIAFAQSLTVERVWTSDGNDNDQTTFVLGDTIQYWVQVNNATGNSISGLFHYEAFLGTINSLNTEIYDQIVHDVTVPVGITTYNMTSTVPNNAQLGAY